MVIIIVTGVWIILTAVNDLLKIKLFPGDKILHIMIITRSLLSISVGLLAVILPLKTAGALIKTVCILLAVYFVLKALSIIYMLVHIKADREINKRLLFSLIEAIAAAVVLFILNGEKVLELIIRITGAVLLVGGAAVAAYNFKAAPLEVKPEKVSDDE